MSAEELARGAVERLSQDPALRGELSEAVYAEILERATEAILRAAAAGACEAELAARIKEIVVDLRDEVENEELAKRSDRRVRRLRPEARRP